VDSVSPSGRLLGLYEGVPLTKRDAHYSASHAGPHHHLHGNDPPGL
jgi:predicted Zn-dependent protease with MMP-like domain